ncbi:MAG TPA: cytochrome b [Rubrivivax sp.]|nr:cytochrome b [Rubrivivax sp.]
MSTPLPSADPLPAAAPARYDNVAVALHWVLALMITGSFFVGLYMADLPFSVQRVKLFNYHKWAGMTILALTLLRLVWRLSHAALPEVPGPRWQQRAAKATHAAIYLLVFAIALVGWAYSSAAGMQVVVYGVLPMPNLLPVNPELADAVKPWHGRLAFMLAALVLLHVAAALKHQFIDRDGLMRRILPGRRRDLPLPPTPHRTETP